MTEIVNKQKQQFSYDKLRKETDEQAEQYIMDALNYFENTNKKKYNFKIIEQGLQYTDLETEDNRVITNEFEIVSVLSKFLCDDYYYSVNMPTVSNPLFSSGTEQINQEREQRNVHGSVHVYGVAIFVAEMLNKLKFNPELTLKDKIITIICAFMHDSCRKGEGVDFWDNDSAILATKLLQHFGLDTEEDKKYLMEVMKYTGDKDSGIKHGDFKSGKKGNWEITQEDLNNPNKIYENKAKIIATIVDLGDTEEVYRVRDNFDIDFFLSKLNKIGISIEGYFNKDGKINKEKQIEIVKLLAREHIILAETKGVGDNQITCLDSDLKKAYKDEIERITGKRILSKIPIQKYGALRTEEIMQNRLKIAEKYPELLKEKEFKSYLDLSDSKVIQKFLFDEYVSRPKTNIVNSLEKYKKKEVDKSIELMRELREENIFFLLRNCGYVIENKKYEIDSKFKPGTKEYNDKKKESDDKKINNGIKDEITEKNFDKKGNDITKKHSVYHIPHEINIDGKKYIAIETIYEDKFVDTDNKIRHREFKIYKHPNKKIATLEDVNSLQKVDEQDIKNMLDPISTNLIEKEKQFQLNRLNRLYPFVDNLFDEDLAKQIKEELENSIDILFDDAKSIEEKFKSKEKLASLLKLIKTSYKKDKEFTDHYLMLTGICNAKTPEELKKELQYLYHVAIPRNYSQERNRENPLKKEVFKDRNIFRGIHIDLDFINKKNIFQNTDNPNIAVLSDYYYTPDRTYSREEKYRHRVIGWSESRGNITSFTSNFKYSHQFTTFKGPSFKGADATIFICKPSKENVGGLIEKAAIIDKGTDTEYNTFKLESQDIAFALKIKGNHIYDIDFNEDYNGEFYIKDKKNKQKLISKHELKEHILSIANDEKKLKNFFENQLVMEKIIEQTGPEIESISARRKDESTIKIPVLFQELIAQLTLDLNNNTISNEDYVKKISKINILIEIYYNIPKSKNIIESQENIKYCLDNDEFYSGFICNSYTNPLNIEKLLQFYNLFDFDQKKYIIEQTIKFIKTNKKNKQAFFYLHKLIKLEPGIIKDNIKLNEISDILFFSNSISDFIEVILMFDNWEKFLEKNLNKILKTYTKNNDIIEFIRICSSNNNIVEYFIQKNTEWLQDTKNIKRLPKLIEILSLNNKGKEYLFGSNKNIDSLIDKFRSKIGFILLPHLLISILNTKEGKEYLLGKDWNCNKICELVGKCGIKEIGNEENNFLYNITMPFQTLPKDKKDLLEEKIANILIKKCLNYANDLDIIVDNIKFFLTQQPIRIDTVKNILKETYKISKDNNIFDEQSFINKFKNVKTKDFCVNYEIIKQWDEEIKKEKKDKEAINPKKFKKEKQQIQPKQKEQFLFKYSKDKISICIEEIIKQKLTQNGIENTDIKIVEEFLNELYKENPNSFELKNIRQNGFNINSKLTEKLDKEKIEKINECLGFEKPQEVSML